MFHNPNITFICHYEKLTEAGFTQLSKILPLHEKLARESLTHYQQLVEACLLSAKLQHPTSRLVFLTDKHTPADMDSSIEVIRFTNDQPFTVYRRLEAQLQFIETNNESNHYLFLDWDILIQKSILTAFQKRFDLGFTYNFDPVMPINGGLIFIHASGKEKAFRFLKTVQAVWNKYYTNEKVWWGDQLSIIKLIGSDTFFRRGSDYLNINGVNLSLLPGSLYNYTNETSLTNMKVFQEYPRVMHFRGMRKTDMLNYWQTFLKKGT